jgi:RNA polymerase sigma factor (sigma-70 family)
VQQNAAHARLSFVSMLPASERHDPPSGPLPDPAAAEAAVTALYAEYAVTLTRMARVMLGDLAAAEDVVQDAFFGLYRRWAFLSDPAKAPQYLRSAVLNGCRSVLRGSARRADRGTEVIDSGGFRGRAVERAEAASQPRAGGAAHLLTDAADVPLLTAEDRRTVLGALRLLPGRQREALVLRYYLDLTDEEIAATMGVRRATVRSAVHRGLAGLERILTRELS